MTTLLSPKLKRLRGSWRRTLVSRTKFFRISGGGAGILGVWHSRGRKARGTGPPLRSEVPDLDDGELHLAARAVDDHLVALGLAQERLPHRGVHADPASLGVGLVRAHYLVGGPLAVLVLEGDGGAEEAAFLLGLVGGVDHRGGVQAALEEVDAAVDLAQALLAVDVFGVLGAVPLRGGGGDFGGHLGALGVEEAEELRVEALRAGAGDVALLPAGEVVVGFLLRVRVRQVELFAVGRGLGHGGTGSSAGVERGWSNLGVVPFDNEWNLW